MPTHAVLDIDHRPKRRSITKTRQRDHIQSRDLVIERQVLGLTQYDLQSNAAIDDRMAGNEAAVSAVDRELGRQSLRGPRLRLQLL